MLSLELEQLDSCILTRKLMLEKLAIQSASGSVEELEEQILAYAHNSKHASQKMEQRIEHFEVQSTKSQSSDGGNFSESGMSSILPLVLRNSSRLRLFSFFYHRKYFELQKVDLLSNPQKLAKYESSQFDSDSSLPDSDSAVSSMGASESSLKPLKKPQKPISKMDSKVELKQIRETLV